MIKAKYLASFLCALGLGLLAQAQTPTTTTPQLPKESLQLPQTLDYELEQLLQRWYEGYAGRAAAPLARTQSMPAPNVPDSVYINKLNRIPSGIRLSYNPIVRESIELYLYRRRPLLSMMMSLGDLYFPEIEAELDRHNLPLELKYLTIVESSLNPSAVSPAGAAGLWQFMIPTARIYNLTINSLVDERMDPIKGTEAACRYLKDLHNIYKDWWLVLAAYNCGPGNVNRAIARAGGGAKSFWEIYPHLPRETRKYVPLYIGVYYAMYYANEYGVQPRELGRTLATEYYEVKKSLSFNKIASITGLSVDQIKTYNPQFRRGIVPWNMEPYQIRLPLKAVMKLEGYKPEELEATELDVVEENVRGGSSLISERPQYIYHRVGKRETVESIAQRYGVSAKQIRDWNGLRKRGLRRGARIIVGIKETPKQKTEPEEQKNKDSLSTKPNDTRAKDIEQDKVESKPSKSGESPVSDKSSALKGRHVVKRGEALLNIAMRYGTTMAKLRQLNKLKNDQISVGQELIVPTESSEDQRENRAEASLASRELREEPRNADSKEEPSETSTKVREKSKREEDKRKAKEKTDKKESRRGKTYTVKSGDTPGAIAKRHGISLKQLRQMNGLKNDRLQIGQELRVK